jgi:hypothetical protein
VFDPNGWMVSKLHLLDFVGGTAVETKLQGGIAGPRDDPRQAAGLGKRTPRRLSWPGIDEAEHAARGDVPA